MRVCSYNIALVVCCLSFYLDIGSETNHVQAMDHQGSTGNETETHVASTSTGKRSWDQVNQSYSSDFFAQTFLESLNYEAEPCDDFYEFVCGKTTNTVYKVAKKNIQQNIKSMLTSNLNAEYEDDEGDDNLSRLIKLYKSCKYQNPDNNISLRKLISDLGGFPLAGQESGWNEEVPFDWVKATVNFRNHGLKLDQFVAFSVRSEGGFYRLFIDMSNAFSFDAELHQDFITVLYPNLDNNFDQLLEVQDFRTKLRQIIESQRDHLIYTNTLADMKDGLPGVDWLRLFEGLIGKEMDSNFRVCISELNLLKSIVELISETSPLVLANHMIMNVIENYAAYLIVPEDLDLLSEFYPNPRCKLVLTKHLGLAMSIEYYNRFVTPSSLNGAIEMIELIRNEIKLMIDEASWISSDQTRSEAKAKIDNMQFEIGISEQLLDPNTSEWFYAGLELDSKKAIENLLQIGRLKHNRLFSDIVNTVSGPYQWIDYDRNPTLENNAFYMRDQNKVLIYGGIIDDIFMDQTRLASINFGLLGVSIGHEMMHAFDTASVVYDSNKLESDWCDELTNKEYISRVDCFRKQYDGLKLEGVEWAVDGQMTLQENIADNAGIEAAYRAYKRWTKDQGVDEPSVLKGVNLEADQLFWVAYASDACVAHNDAIDYQYDVYSPPRTRVNVPLSNFEEFSLDFHCPSNAKLNPKHKCKIL